MEHKDTLPPEQLLDDAIARTQVSISRIHLRIEELTEALRHLPSAPENLQELPAT
jgi:hypothetical protein